MLTGSLANWFVGQNLTAGQFASKSVSQLAGSPRGSARYSAFGRERASGTARSFRSFSSFLRIRVRFNSDR